MYATHQDEVYVTLNDTDKKATVSYGFNDSVTGEVIIALYSGKEFVGMKKCDAEKSFGGTTEVLYTKTPDKIKVMAWKGFENILPLRRAITVGLSCT